LEFSLQGSENMAEIYSFFNSITGDTRTYNADDWARYFDKFIETGIYNYADNLAVTAAGIDMSVNVGIGVAFIDGRMYENTASLNLAVDTAEVTDDRIDLVVVRLDNNQSARYIKCFVKKGTPGTLPVAPTLQNDAYVQEIALAEIFVTAGKSFIDSTQLTDKRSTDYVNPFVDGNRLNTAEDNIANHETRITSAESTITSHGTRLTTAETDITNLKSTDTSHDTRITTVEGKLVQSDRTKQTLTYGTSLINGVTSSPLDVQIDGKTLVNHSGREGGFHKQGKWNANLVIDTANYKFGTSSGKIDNSAGTGAKLSDNKQKMYLSGKYILFGVWAKAVSGTPDTDMTLLGYNADGSFTGTSFKVGKLITSGWVFYYGKTDLTASTVDHWVGRAGVLTYGTADDVVNFDGLVVYDIPKETYDKIGVSLTDQQVADMFPYVDSVQHNQNPIVTVEGENLLPPFYEWTLHANAKAISPYELEVVATEASQMSTVVINVVSGQTYTISAIHNGSLVIHKGNSTANTTVVNTTNQSATFTVDDSFNGQIVVRLNNATSGTFTFEQPMLNLGSTAKPFVPRNPSHLYASVKLGELSDKKDILFKEGTDWKKRSELVLDYKLDGSLAWVFGVDAVGFKELRYKFPVIDFVNDTGVFMKYDGKILQKINGGTSISGSDQATLSNGANSVYLSVPDTDSGWSDAWTGTELTADWIKAYFNGWKYTGTADKVTLSWVSVVDGSASPTQTLAYVSANKAPSYTPYLLSYQLATPQTVVVTDKVEGDLSISGLAQVSVDSGLINREKTNPVKSGTEYLINHKTVSSGGSILKHRAKKIISVFKNGVEDKLWIIENNSGAYGEQLVKISESNFDTSAEYRCSYVLLDKYKFTVNPLSIPVWYSGSLASTVATTVAKQSDMATQISVNVAAIVDLYARVKALGG
jgi:hypothetical protein